MKKLLLALCLLSPLVFGQSQKISQMAPATLPLTLSELVPLVQPGPCPGGLCSVATSVVNLVGASYASPDSSIIFTNPTGSLINAVVSPTIYGGALNVLPGVYAFTGLPSAATHANQYASTNDQGGVYSNGSFWQILYNPTSGTLRISSGNPLPNGQNGTVYSTQLTATNAVGTVTWSKVSQYAVTGTANTFTVSSSGVVADATEANNSTTAIVVQAVDSTGASAQQTVTVTVVGSLSPAATPTFSPAGGTYTAAQTVTISDTTSSPTIFYTTNGTTPTTSSPVYTAPITVSTTSTVSAIATASGSTQSAVGSAAYTISAGGSPAGACSATSGNGKLALNVITNRSTGISPLLVFFDGKGTTDSTITGATSVFQDVTFTENFGDTGASGTGTWAYGSHPGVNSRNTATGGAAAHLYIVTPGAGDQTFTTTVTAADAAANTASCTLTVTVYDPSGANGFPGTQTTCVSAATLPVAGAAGCPAGAAVLTQSNFATAIAAKVGNGKQLLFKCGDTFTGDNAIASGVTWGIGAYGSCVGTQTGRPILSDTTNGNQIIGFDGAAGDGRISDLDLEGNGDGARGVWDSVFNVGGSIKIVYQITLNNLLANGTNEAYGWAQGAQMGLVNSVQSGETGIGTYPNFNENNPGWSGNTVNNLDYQAIIGNSLDGTGASTSGGVEVLRISACRMCVIADNTVQNANSTGAALKLHNGNTNNSSATPWTGIYTENVVIADNAFGGTSGAQLVENAPQNGADDERLRNIVFERNYLTGCTSQGGRQLLVSAANETVRDNVFNLNCTSSLYPAAGVIASARGIEPTPTGVEIYNNTCYQPTNVGSTQNCILLTTNTCCTGAPAQNSFVKNNLSYSVTGKATVVNTGTGNTVSSNTATTTANPSFTNAGGSFALISDFRPTANFSGGVSVPVLYDALGALWTPTWDLGAVSSFQYNFHPGDYMESGNINGTGASNQAEMNLLTTGFSTATGVQGYMALYRWPQLESTQGSYAAGFANILADYNYLQSVHPGARFAIGIISDYPTSSITVANIPSHTFSNQIVPNYILNAPSGTLNVYNTATYPTSSGATTAYTLTAQANGQYGFGFTDYIGSGSTASYIIGASAFWDPGVNAAWINLWKALGQFAAANMPLLELVQNGNEVSYNFNQGPYTPAGSGTHAATAANYRANYKTWAQAATAAFPHTIVGIDVTFIITGSDGTSETSDVYNTVNGVLSSSQLGGIQGLMLLTSDTYGASWTAHYNSNAGARAAFSRQAFFGIHNPVDSGASSIPFPPVNTSLAGIMPSGMQEQTPDLSTSMYTTATQNGTFYYNTAAGVSQLIQASNGAPPSGSGLDSRYTYGANYRFWVPGPAPDYNIADWGSYIQPTFSTGLPVNSVRPSNLP